MVHGGRVTSIKLEYCGLTSLPEAISNVHNWLKLVEVLALLLTFQVCLVIKVKANLGHDELNRAYDFFLVTIVLLMLAIFVASTVLAVWRSQLLRQKIGAIDASGLLDESSIRQGAAMCKHEWQARRASEEKKRGAQAQSMDSESVSSGETEASAEATQDAAMRRQAREKRNALATDRRDRREADKKGGGGGGGGGLMMRSLMLITVLSTASAAVPCAVGSFKDGGSCTACKSGKTTTAAPRVLHGLPWIDAGRSSCQTHKLMYSSKDGPGGAALCKKTCEADDTCEAMLWRPGRKSSGYFPPTLSNNAECYFCLDGAASTTKPCKKEGVMSGGNGMGVTICNWNMWLKTKTGATSEKDCSQCATNYFRKGAATCVACPTGSNHTKIGSIRLSDCRSSCKGNQTLHNAKCVFCPVGRTTPWVRYSTCCGSVRGRCDYCCGGKFYCSSNGAAYAAFKGGVSCPFGVTHAEHKGLNPVCPSGPASSGGATAMAGCSLCSENHHFMKGAVCAACPAGSNHSRVGSTTVLDCKTSCKADEYLSAGVCIACPLGRQSRAGSSVCACAQGMYWNRSTCVACAAGRTTPHESSMPPFDKNFSLSIGALEAAQCSACAADHYRELNPDLKPERYAVDDGYGYGIPFAGFKFASCDGSADAVAPEYGGPVVGPPARTIH